MKNESRRFQPHQDARSAFTFTELLVMIGIVGLLAMMLMPAFAGNRTNSHVARCMSNLRQMQMGWMAYSADYRGTICPTAGTADPTGPNWVYGRMDLPGEDQDTTLIKKGLLWPYVKTLPAYKCPADPRLSIIAKAPTDRSISINAWLNPITSPSLPGHIFQKQSDISRSFSPSQCWVFMDENPATINDAWLIVPATGDSWTDVPATYHDKACGISFADGHGEMKKWSDKNVLTSPALFMPAIPPYSDLRWLQARSTVP